MDFEIKDKRSHFTDETDISKEQATQKPTEPVTGINTVMPVTFVSFILSLATSALMHLGQEGSPQGQAGAVQLPLARQVIDLITLLEEKTKGNLTSDEAEMIAQTLFALRIKFVDVEKKLRH